MYITRKIDSFLERWKARQNRKPLIIRGARQIGKTESIRHFAAKHYASVVEINFIDAPLFKTITAEGYKPENIIAAISRIDNSFRFVPGETLIFFDEVQAHPDITTSLKFFCQDGRYDVICSGSLLGLHYRQVSSNSVGYREDCEMHSLDFCEFLVAKGYPSTIADEMLAHLADSGLLVAQLDGGAQEDLRVRRNFHTYNGGLFENIVAEAIRKSGGDLYYYRREDSKLEEDFFLRSRSGIVPIEVKATGGRSKSLRTLIDSDHYPDISFGVKVANANVGSENGVHTVPHFCAFLLKDWLAQKQFESV